MKLLDGLAFLGAFILNYRETKTVRKSRFAETVLSTREHIELAADWLIKAQENSSDGGYSRLYSLYKQKWDSSYIETTGYIIPTMMRVSSYLQDEKYRESAGKAALWLLGVQNLDGSFSDIDDITEPKVFDTGQCLLGLNYMYSATHEKKFLEAAKKAGDWLSRVQEENGSWIKYAYFGIPHAYYTRVAAALIELGSLSNESRYTESGLKNVNWAISCQKENGFFESVSFKEGDAALLHTMVYVLEGLLHAFQITGERYILGAVLKNAEKLKEINLQREIILYANYDQAYIAKTKSRCITGLAQWAGICLDLYEITEDADYRKIATRTIYYLKSKQIMEGENLLGGFTGSIPFYAGYATGKVVNWNNKFFIDALLKFSKYDISLDEEHEEWVSGSFSFTQDVVVDGFSKSDQEYLKRIENVLEKYAEPITFVDLGCGKGKFIKYLEKKYPLHDMVGIDPFFFAEGDKIKQGSAYSIPLDDQSVDVLIILEVLQHIRDIDKALSEIRRVLKDNGILIIGERNKHSGLGLLKFFLERTGRWMYVSDSPFVERWYTKREWEKMLRENQFWEDEIFKINIDRKFIPFFNRYYCILAKVKKCAAY